MDGRFLFVDDDEPNESRSDKLVIGGVAFDVQKALLFR